VLNNPNVQMVLSGMNRISEVEENVETCSTAIPNAMSAEEVAVIDAVRSSYRLRVDCTECGYCMPCPSNINIPAAFKYLNSSEQFSSFMARMGYMMSAGVRSEDGKPHWASDCIDCKRCEKKCPQHIEVRKVLKEVTKDFEGPSTKVIAAAARVVVGKRR
jgi:predicted aldo/keto reductase-like oxidoreductase